MNLTGYACTPILQKGGVHLYTSLNKTAPITPNKTSLRNMPDPSTHVKAIRRFYQHKKRMPSYTEIATLLAFRSRNAAVKIVAKLIAERLLAKDETGRIIPGPHFDSVKVLGTIEAGWPSPAEEVLLDTKNLNEYLIRNREATILLAVTGRSM